MQAQAQPRATADTYDSNPRQGNPSEERKKKKKKKKKKTPPTTRNKHGDEGGGGETKVGTKDVDKEGAAAVVDQQRLGAENQVDRLARHKEKHQDQRLRSAEGVPWERRPRNRQRQGGQNGVHQQARVN